MKVKDLTIRNFGSIAEASLDLSSRGLTLILGHNEDAPKASSNGAGKSLLLDAFAWCLWGQTIRGLAHDEVVCERVGQDCQVDLQLAEGGQEYLITRYRKNKSDLNHKPNDLVLYARKASEWVDVSGFSVQDTQAKVDDLVGFDFVSFCAMMPGAGIKLSELTDKQIKVLLERLLQTEVLGKAHKYVSEKLKDLTSTQAVVEAQLEALTTNLAAGADRVSTLRESYENFEAQQTRRIVSIRSKIDRAENEMLKCNITISEGIRAKANKLSAQQRIQAAEESLKTTFARISELRTAATTELQDLRTQEKKCLFWVEHYVARLGKLQALGASCAECEQSIDDVHKQRLLGEVVKEREAVDARLARIRTSITKREAALVQDLEPLNMAIANYRASSVLAEKDLATATASTRDSEFAQRHKRALEAGIVQCNGEIAEVFKEKNVFVSLLEAAKLQQQQYEEDLDALTKKQGAYRHKAALLEFWVKGFSQSGVRSHMLQHVTPVLNAAAAKYCDLLTSGEMQITFHTQESLKNGQIKEKFNIQVSQRHGGSSYTANSTGERSRANLVIALALGDLASMRVNKQLPFRFLDEPFESVDESGTEAIVKFLNDQKDVYESVFVITHQAHFKQLFPNKVTVVKKNGISRLEDT